MGNLCTTPIPHISIIIHSREFEQELLYPKQQRPTKTDSVTLGPVSRSIAIDEDEDIMRIEQM